MELNSLKEGDVLCVEVSGRLDSTSASNFERSVNEESGDSKDPVVLDLENLAYISSAGLRAILLLTKTANAKGSKLALCALPPQVDEVFQISGFDKIIPIYKTRGDAVSSLG